MLRSLDTHKESGINILTIQFRSLYKRLASVIFPVIQKALDLEHWLLPFRCLKCDKVLACEDPFCEECHQNLPYQSNGCERCGQVYNSIEAQCGRCINNPPEQNFTFYPFSYLPPISEEIQRLKYSERPENAKRLSLLLAEEILAAGIELPELLVPVPMHVSRLRSRGYNHSALLCKHLARILEIECDLFLLKKIRNTTPQVEMTLTQRKLNVHNSFSVSGPIRVKHLAVVDDVFTTGSTSNEACRTLRQHGAVVLDVWALAHTL